MRLVSHGGDEPPHVVIKIFRIPAVRCEGSVRAGGAGRVRKGAGQFDFSQADILVEILRRSRGIDEPASRTSSVGVGRDHSLVVHKVAGFHRALNQAGLGIDRVIDDAVA